tara:strand:+ start:79 stop:495 length:417 start_codon:yes stop_codon:yes gene_type:complete
MGRVFFNTRKNIVDLTAATTILPGDSGNVFMINQGAAFAITLPTPALAQRGWNAEFIVGTAAANAQTITCPGTDLFHGIGVDGEDGAAQTVTEGTGIDVITIAAVAVKADRVSITCDGVNYYFVSFAADKAHITIAAE